MRRASYDLYAALEDLIDAIDFEGPGASVNFAAGTAYEAEVLRNARKALAEARQASPNPDEGE